MVLSPLTRAGRRGRGVSLTLEAYCPPQRLQGQLLASPLTLEAPVHQGIPI